MNTIFIRELRIETRIGVYEWEQHMAQPLLIDIELEVPSAKAFASDNFADEGLHPDYRADHVAVDIDVSDPHAGHDISHGLVDPAVYSQRQPITSVVDRVEDCFELVRSIADHVQYGAEYLPLEAVDAI